MKPTDLRIGLQVLTGSDLDGYIPDNRFWTLRSMWQDTGVATAVDARSVKLIVMRVVFYNESDSPMEVAFDNTACKAELQNLVFCDGEGNQIQPVRQLHIRPKTPAKPKPVDAHSAYACDIIGEVSDGWIVFPGARYPVPSNRILDACFRFEGWRSNVVRLST